MQSILGLLLQYGRFSNSCLMQQDGLDRRSDMETTTGVFLNHPVLAS